MQKWGKKYGRQNYKCQQCRHSFQNQERTSLKRQIHLLRLYGKYAKEQQILKHLARDTGISPRTLRRRFDTFPCITGELKTAGERSWVAVTMDVTFFNAFGLLLCRAGGKNLYWDYVKTESLEAYRKAVDILTVLGYRFAACTIDGKRGVRQVLERILPGVPVQYCHAHQIATVKRYIPGKAQTEAARALRRLALRISSSHFVQFETALAVWHVLYGDFLDEKTVCNEPNKKRRWRYTHEKLRSAYHSLKRNLPYLYTYQKNLHADIPNTTNACDGFFSHLKERVNRHRGLSMKRKKNLIQYLLENWDSS